MGWRIILEVGGFALGRKDLKPDAFRTFDLSKPQDRKKSSKLGDCEGYFKSVPLVTKSSQELPSSDLRHLQRHSGRLLARKSWSKITQEFEFSEVNLHTTTWKIHEIHVSIKCIHPYRYFPSQHIFCIFLGKDPSSKRAMTPPLRSN